jgi:membrane protein CcdC involved in cytochrome C biogenesis
MILSVVLQHGKQWFLASTVPAATFFVSLLDFVNIAMKAGQLGLVILGLVFSVYQIKKIRLEIKQKKSGPTRGSESGS